MGLPNIGPLELIIILAIALLIVGPAAARDGLRVRHGPSASSARPPPTSRTRAAADSPRAKTAARRTRQPAPAALRDDPRRPADDRPRRPPASATAAPDRA